MDDKRKAASAEFLDEKVAEEIVIARKVAHVHDLGGPPCTLEDGRAGARRRRHCGHCGPNARAGGVRDAERRGEDGKRR